MRFNKDTTEEHDEFGFSKDFLKQFNVIKDTAFTHEKLYELINNVQFQQREKISNHRSSLLGYKLTIAEVDELTYISSTNVDYHPTCKYVWEKQYREWRLVKRYMRMMNEEIFQYLNRELMAPTPYFELVNRIGHNNEFIEEVKNHAFPDPNQKLPSKRIMEYCANLIKPHSKEIRIQPITRYPPNISSSNIISSGGIVGKYEGKCLDYLEKILNEQIERLVRVGPYTIDGYIRSLKVFIEYNEKHHYRAGGLHTEKDLRRTKAILDCVPDHIIIPIKDKLFRNNRCTVVDEVSKLIEERRLKLFNTKIEQ